MARHMSDMKWREFELRRALEDAIDYIDCADISPSDVEIYHEKETLLARLRDVLETTARPQE